MNSKNPEVQPKTPVADATGDSAKLLSLLALATGAVAMPQTSNADIVYTDLTANPIHVGPAASSSYVINTLPGTAQLGFHTRIIPNSVGGLSSSRSIIGRQQAGYVRIKSQGSFFVMANAGQTWNQIAGNSRASALGGYNNYFNYSPKSYNEKYLLFRFKDSTQPGSPFRYGWVELGLANDAGNGNFPDIAIEGYAWDTSGARIASGQVPEPSSAALVALGALTLGAKGLRSFRKNRQAKA
jgi:hypothetical protein